MDCWPYFDERLSRAVHNERGHLEAVEGSQLISIHWMAVG
jgi:hypothetical protein